MEDHFFRPTDAPMASITPHALGAPDNCPPLNISLPKVAPGFDRRKAEAEFRMLESLSTACAPADFSSKLLRFPTACSHRSMGKNRYPNILPDEPTRVKLERGAGSSTSHSDHEDDYINANYVLGGQFIASQAPLPSTLADWWWMVWQHRTPVIVMLTKLYEHGRKKADCYWPNSVGEALIFGRVRVRLESYIPEEAFEGRVFSLELVGGGGGERRYVYHYLYSQWPDFGVPPSTKGIRELVKRTRRTYERSRDLLGPIIVHCSAGVGRTGAFIAIYHAMQRPNDPTDILETVTKLREGRTGMVQTEDQYLFIAMTIADHQAELRAGSQRARPLTGSLSATVDLTQAPSSPGKWRLHSSCSDLECIRT